MQVDATNRMCSKVSGIDPGTLGTSLDRWNTIARAATVAAIAQLISSSSSSSSNTSRTDRWVHFQQNAGLRLFVHT